MKDKLIGMDKFKELLRDGMVIMTGGYASCGVPDRLLRMAVESGVKDLTIISNDSAYPGYGVSNLVAAGQVKKMITTHIGRNPLTGNLYREGKLELELVPQGTLAERIRAAGVGLGGVLTEAGLGTEVEYGKEKVTVLGKEYLLELPLHADLALIRGSVADRFGNIYYRGTTVNFNPLMAMAADQVVAEAGKIVEVGELTPEETVTPGIFIDYIVGGNV